MWVYLYPNNTETELKNAYIGEWVDVTSLTLNKNSITLTTVWQTEQITATTVPAWATVNWSSSDTTVATVSTTWLVTCVTPWECTITATTVNGLTATCGVKQSRLPSEYQEVEWIWSSGTQYINTGVKASNTLSTKLVMQPNTSYTSEYAVFGDAWSANALFFMEYNGRYRLHNWWNYWDFASVIAWETTIETNSTWIIINGTSYSLTAGSNYSNNNIWLFATWDGIQTSRRGRFQVYSFQISNNNVLVRDFVPCYRIADTVIWLYDIVNNVFYTNAGGGTFNKWWDV
jgi:hypothetical protein